MLRKQKSPPTKTGCKSPIISPAANINQRRQVKISGRLDLFKKQAACGPRELADYGTFASPYISKLMARAVARRFHFLQDETFR
jgi:hypothetical protein